MPFLSLPLFIVAIPDHRAHQLCRLVAAAVIRHFPMGKMLRDHFTKPLQWSLLRKLLAGIQWIPDDAGGSVMWLRQANEPVIPSPQECVGHKIKYTGTGSFSNGSNVWDTSLWSNGSNRRGILSIQSGTDGVWENTPKNIYWNPATSYGNNMHTVGIKFGVILNFYNGPLGGQPTQQWQRNQKTKNVPERRTHTNTINNFEIYFIVTPVVTMCTTPDHITRGDIWINWEIIQMYSQTMRTEVHMHVVVVFPATGLCNMPDSWGGGVPTSDRDRSIPSLSR